jgi:phage shock protein A
VKAFLYWLLGDRGGRIVVGSFAWLMGAPIEKGDAQTVAIGQQALDDIAENLQNMRSAVAEQKGALEQALGFLAQLESDAAQLEKQSRQLVQAGDDDGALNVLTELGVVTDSIPQIQSQAEQAKQNYEASFANLQDMERQYKKYQLEQKISAKTQKVSAALAQANKYSGAGAESAKSVLEATKDSVKNKSFVENAKLEMNSLPGKTTRKVNELGAAEKLAALKASMNLPQIEGQKHD